MQSPRHKVKLAYVLINVNEHPTGASPWYVFELGGDYIPMQECHDIQKPLTRGALVYLLNSL